MMSSGPSPKAVKDTWRVVSRDREDDVYKLLKEKNIPWCRQLMMCQVKTRFLFTIVAITSSSTDFKLTTCSAHKAAYELARTLHRDISAHSIMIGPDNHALLIDWDISKHRDDRTPSASERTGTWQFAAARLLKPESPIPDLADDLESFVHVLTWVALRHTRLATGSVLSRLGAEMQKMFDDSYEDSTTGELKGGDGKSAALLALQILRYLPESPLSGLLNELFHLVSVRYEENPEKSKIKLPARLQGDLLLHYKERLEQLESSDHIIQLFESSLGENNWPSSDGAVENPIPEHEDRIIKKRTADIDGEDNSQVPSSSNKRSRET